VPLIGRFCEWHPNPRDYVVPDEGNDIRRARAELLRDLERAGNAVPGDDWIVGQRIRYLVEGHDSSVISVARSCKATKLVVDHAGRTSTNSPPRGEHSRHISWLCTSGQR